MQRHLITDREGTPLALSVTGANRHDSIAFEPLIDELPAIRRKRGRPLSKPGKMHVDKAYDIERCRINLRLRGTKTRTARKGVESKERLGRHRWMVVHEDADDYFD